MLLFSPLEERSSGRGAIRKVRRPDQKGFALWRDTMVPRINLAYVTILFLRLRVWLSLREAAKRHREWIPEDHRDLLQLLTPCGIESDRTSKPMWYEELRSIRVMPNGDKYYCIVLMGDSATCFLDLTTEALTKSGAIAAGRLASLLLGVPLELRKDHALK
jgi:hypothetical protein